MKRGRIAWLAVVAAVLYVLRAACTEPSLLKDTDTSVLLDAIRQRHNPLSWFVGDWPLANHFYRPIPTLTFELDNRLYGSHGAGYGCTNALVCVLCVLALFWLVAELSESLAFAASCGALFAFWHAPVSLPLALPVNVLILATLVVAALRRQVRWTIPVSAGFVISLAYSEFYGMHSDLRAGSLSWLPARTATVMTVFCLIACAAYARFVRLTSTRKTPPITPLTPPATRSSLQIAEKRSLGWPWMLLAALGSALALASYEQAIMLPGVLVSCGVVLSMRGFHVNWKWHAVFFGLLFGYLAFRSHIIPASTSGYQKQQLRYGPGVYFAISDYFLPVVAVTYGFAKAFSGVLGFFTQGPYMLALDWATQLTSYWQARRQALAIGGLVMSVIAFLPMAWLKEFRHYHYWPMALRSMFVVGLAVIAAELLVTAWSPRVRQAPSRPSPAPGSLPRP